jgi:hypothetical protein
LIHPQSLALAEAFISNFYAADDSIEWIATEREVQLWLAPNTLLVGRMDALGRDEGKNLFFGEWKTASAYTAKKMGEVKAAWRFDPQSLTYGVLGTAVDPSLRRFTVRWAIKTNPPICDFEWYTYADAEIEWWRSQVLEIADTIRANRKKVSIYPNWQVNPAECLKYGAKYVCPHYHEGCSKLDFNRIPDGFANRISHLELEREWQKKISNFSAKTLDSSMGELVVLDATRIDTWLGCQEKYRKGYEQSGWGIQGEPTEALTIGSDFHAILREHYRCKI